MRGTIRSSRDRFDEYAAKRKAAGEHERVADRVEERDKALAKGKKRSFRALFVAFWGFLRGTRSRLAVCLLTLTVATGLGLTVPYSTKITVDYILTDAPGPIGLPGFVESIGLDRAEMAADVSARWPLLVVLGMTILTMSLAAAVLGMWGRWHCTRITKRTQMTLRRLAFGHAVRLPLTRISDLKSGGVASILREDAGNAAELVFSMIYNPWRAIVQLGGTLTVLAIVDWRMLLGSLLLVPTVYFSHRAWIGRIRPVYRDIRRTRQTIDGQAAESFGGIRVVRGFNRGDAEAGRFARDNHFMSRQELMAWWWSRMVELVWMILIPLASAAVLLYGGSRVLEGAITIGDLMAFTAYVMMLLGPVESLVGSAAEIQRQLSGLDRTLDLLEEDHEFGRAAVTSGRDAAGERAPKPEVDRATTLGAIRFEGVSFAYPRSKPMRLGTATAGAELEGGVQAGIEGGIEGGAEAGGRGTPLGRDPTLVLEDISFE
ncbi:MAG: ABC transporter ATP-binding protein, partial [Planctomycetota bacterium]